MSEEMDHLLDARKADLARLNEREAARKSRRAANRARLASTMGTVVTHALGTVLGGVILAGGASLLGIIQRSPALDIASMLGLAVSVMGAILGARVTAMSARRANEYSERAAIDAKYQHVIVKLAEKEREERSSAERSPEA